MRVSVRVSVRIVFFVCQKKRQTIKTGYDIMTTNSISVAHKS